MNRIGRMIAWLIGITAALFVMAGAGQVSVQADGEHVHCYCGDGTCTDGNHSHAADTVWNAWTESTSLPTSGNWYLTADVTVSAATQLVENTELNLCLNGHTVTSTGGFMFNLADGGTSTENNLTLRVTDCAATAGKLDVNGSGRAFRIDSSAHVEVYRITVDSSNATGTYGTIAYLSGSEKNLFKAFGATMIGGTATAGGGAFYADAGTSTNYPQIELYRSALSGGKVVSSTATASLEGGNIALKGYARLILDNSTVSGGSLTYSGTESRYCKGGNISGLSNSRITISGTSRISDGIVEGTKWSAGGNLNAQGYLTITGSVTIENGDGQNDGGNIYMTGSQAKNITGATFTGGKASCGGSITCDNSSKATFTNCTIAGGETTSFGGNLYIKGDGTSACTVVLNNTTVREGLVNPASSSNAKVHGGNISITGKASHSLTIDGSSLITDGKVKNGSGNDASSFGGNIGISVGTVTLQGQTTVKNGWVQTSNGFNICAYGGDLVIKGNAVVPGGKVSYNGATTQGNSVSTNAKGSTITVEENATVGTIQCVATNSLTVVKGGYVGDLSNYNGAVTIEGGIIKNLNGTGNTDANNSLEIKGGYIQTLTRTTKNGNYFGTCTISGGAFGTLPAAAAYTLGEGCQLVAYAEKVDYTDSANEAGTFTTTKKAVVTDHHHALSIHADVQPDGTTADVYYIPWDQEDSLPTVSGNYYLTKNVAVTAQYNPAVDVNICLNGFTISNAAANKRPIMMQQKATMGVCDCGTTGKIQGGTLTSGTAGVVGVSGQTKGAVPVFNLYSGTITGGTLNATGAEDGGGIFGINKGGVVNIYGGTVSAGSTKGQGGIAIIRTGTPSGGSATPGELHIFGGTLNGGTAEGKGQAIAAVGGILEIAGGEITGSTNDTIWIGENAASVTISGGKIGNGEIVSDALTGFITGGYFAVEPAEECIAEGFGAYESGVTGYPYEIAEVVVIDVTSRAATGYLGAVGAVSGGGIYKKGAAFTLTAPEVAGYRLIGWYEGDTRLDTTAEYSFSGTANAAQTIAAVYEVGVADGFSITITGTADFTIDGTLVSGSTKYAAGQQITVTYTGTDAFDGWMNRSGKPVSREAAYTFTLTGDTELTVSLAAADAAMAVFYNASHQVMSSKLLSAVTDADLAAVPSVLGKTNGRWIANGQTVTTAAELIEAAGSQTTVSVAATYDDDGSTYTVTVIGKEAGDDPAEIGSWAAHAVGDGAFTANLGQVAAISAAADGFLYFADSTGNPVSYANETNVRFTGNATLYAVYGDAVTAEAIVSMVGAERQGNTVFFEALRSLPENCTVSEQGILFTLTSSIGSAQAEDVLVYNYDASKVYKYQSNGKLLNDVTGLTMKNVSASVTARAYVIYSDGTHEGVIYSDIATVD